MPSHMYGRFACTVPSRVATVQTDEARMFAVQRQVASCDYREGKWYMQQYFTVGKALTYLTELCS